MTYAEYADIVARFRREVIDVKRKSPFQQRKAVDLMKMAKRMDDYRSPMDIVGCSNQMLRLWRGRYA